MVVAVEEAAADEVVKADMDKVVEADVDKVADVVEAMVDAENLLRALLVV